MNKETIKKLDRLSFNSLDLLGIDWRSKVKNNSSLQKEYLEYLQLKSNWVYMSIDYSQLEYYVLASLCGDASLVAAVNAGMDIHSFNTEKIFKLNLKQLENDRANAITPRDIKNAEACLLDFKAKRKITKALTFSLSYGAGKEKIAQDLHISVWEAEKLIKDFYNAYPKIKLWQGTTLLGAINNGYLETKFGRRRATPKLLGRMDIYDAFIKENAKTISKLKKDGEYWSLREEFKTVLNTDIQSLSSDMCSLAAHKFKEWLKIANKKAEIYFWVHDSIAYASHIDDCVEVSEKVRTIMENEVKYTGDPVNYRTALEVGYNYEWSSEIIRDHWLNTDNKKELILKHLDESLDKDINKKLKLIIKSTAADILNNDYLKEIRDTKSDYFDKLVEKLGIDGIGTPIEYMAWANNVSIEEYNASMGFDSNEDEESIEE